MKAKNTATTSNNLKNDPGKKLDAGKLRVDLVPVEAIYAMARAYTFGSKKYGDRNWEKGISWTRCYGALLRHIFAWFLKSGPDIESGLSHLDHAMACLSMLSHFRAHKRYKKFDDRP